jgi:hypothetical protein
MGGRRVRARGVYRFCRVKDSIEPKARGFIKPSVLRFYARVGEREDKEGVKVYEFVMATPWLTDA